MSAYYSYRGVHRKVAALSRCSLLLEVQMILKLRLLSWNLSHDFGVSGTSPLSWSTLTFNKIFIQILIVGLVFCSGGLLGLSAQIT